MLHLCDIFRYTCKNNKDGIAVKKGNDGTMEGSDNRDQSYECNGDGEYTVPKDPLSGLPEFPFCIPRRKNIFSVATYISVLYHSYLDCSNFQTIN